MPSPTLTAGVFFVYLLTAPYSDRGFCLPLIHLSTSSILCRGFFAYLLVFTGSTYSPVPYSAEVFLFVYPLSILCQSFFVYLLSTASTYPLVSYFAGVFCLPPRIHRVHLFISSILCRGFFVYLQLLLVHLVPYRGFLLTHSYDLSTSYPAKVFCLSTATTCLLSFHLVPCRRFFVYLQLLPVHLISCRRFFCLLIAVK